MKNTNLSKLAAVALLGVCIAGVPAYAATEDDVQSDLAAIHKDNDALRKDREALRKDRAAKAEAKANDDNGQQAVESAKIGTVQGAIAEKQTEKNVDVNTLQQDKSNLNNNNSDSNTQ